MAYVYTPTHKKHITITLTILIKKNMMRPSSKPNPAPQAYAMSISNPYISSLLMMNIRLRTGTEFPSTTNDNLTLNLMNTTDRPPGPDTIFS